MHIKSWKIPHRKLCLPLILKVNAQFQGRVKMRESDWQLEFQRQPMKIQPWLPKHHSHRIYQAWAGCNPLGSTLGLCMFYLQSPAWKEKHELYSVPIKRVTEAESQTNTDLHTSFWNQGRTTHLIPRPSICSPIKIPSIYFKRLLEISHWTYWIYFTDILIWARLSLEVKNSSK